MMNQVLNEIIITTLKNKGNIKTSLKSKKLVFFSYAYFVEQEDGSFWVFSSYWRKSKN